MGPPGRNAGSATTVLRLAVRLLAIRARHQAGRPPVLLVSDEDGGGGSWIPADEEAVIHDAWEDVEELAPCDDDAVDDYVDGLLPERVEELEGGSNAVRLLVKAAREQIHRLLCQMTCNSMTLAPEEQVRRATSSKRSARWDDFGVGLYPSGAMLNHSCSPSCLWFVRGGVLVVETVRPVRIGEELTIPYLPVSGGVVSRRRRIRATFGFHCLCRRCDEEDAAASEKKTTRATLRRAAQVAGVPRGKVLKKTKTPTRAAPARATQRQS